MGLLLPIVSGLGFVLSIVGFGIGVALRKNLGDMNLEISRTAFFKTRDIYASQIPYLEAVAFSIFLFMTAVRIIEYYRIDFQMRVSQNHGEREQYYLVRAKLAQALEWSNIAVTQAFILLTLALALIIGIIFCINGQNYADDILIKYQNNEKLSEHDRHTLHNLDGQLQKFTVIEIMNFLGLGCILLQLIAVLVGKFRL